MLSALMGQVKSTSSPVCKTHVHFIIHRTDPGKHSVAVLGIRLWSIYARAAKHVQHAQHRRLSCQSIAPEEPLPWISVSSVHHVGDVCELRVGTGGVWHAA